MAKQQVLRIRLQAYDHKILDLAVEKIIDVAKKTGAGSLVQSLFRRKNRSTPFSALPSNTRIAANSSRSGPTRD